MKKIIGIFLISLTLVGTTAEARVSSRSSVSRSSVRSVSRSTTRVSSPRPKTVTTHKASYKANNVKQTVKSTKTTNVNKNTNINKNTKVKNVTVNKTIVNNNPSRIGSNDGFFTGMLMGNLLSRPSTTVVSPAVHSGGYYGNSDVVYVDSNDDVELVGNKTVVRKNHRVLEFLAYILVIVSVISICYYIFKKED